MEEFTVVKYLGKTKKNSLKNDKLYGVETNKDLVEPEIYEDFGCVTVWDDAGQLHEIEKESFEVISVSEKDWWNTVPEKRYLEIY